MAELSELLQKSEIAGTEGEAITVEMIGHPLWVLKRVAFLETGNPFYAVWDNGLSGSFSELLKQVAGRVKSMDLIRLGFDVEEPSRNTIVVSITVSDALDPPDWDAARLQMLEPVR